jgi:hypothetical protein
MQVSSTHPNLLRLPIKSIRFIYKSPHYDHSKLSLCDFFLVPDTLTCADRKPSKIFCEDPYDLSPTKLSKFNGLICVQNVGSFYAELIGAPSIRDAIIHALVTVDFPLAFSKSLSSIDISRIIQSLKVSALGKMCCMLNSSFCSIRLAKKERSGD